MTELSMLKVYKIEFPRSGKKDLYIAAKDFREFSERLDHLDQIGLTNDPEMRIATCLGYTYDFTAEREGLVLDLPFMDVLHGIDGDYTLIGKGQYKNHEVIVPLEMPVLPNPNTFGGYKVEIKIIGRMDKDANQSK